MILDGIERKDLVNVQEISSEKAVVEVPEYMKKRKITNGTIDIPVIQAVFKVQRDSDTIKYFKDYYMNNEVKECILIRTDGHGAEFGRTLYTACECAKYTETAYDGANPTWVQISTILVPYDMIVQDA